MGMTAREYIGAAIGVFAGIGLTVLAAQYASLDMGQALFIGFGLLIAGAHIGRAFAE